jgi:hypothetical protein
MRETLVGLRVMLQIGHQPTEGLAYEKCQDAYAVQVIE